MRISDWSSDVCSSDLTFLETIRTRGGSILKPETVDAMMSVQVRSDNLNQGPGWAFGYGAAVLEDPSRSGTPQSPGTYQGDSAYGHKWVIDPVEHLTVATLANTTFEGMNGAVTKDVRAPGTGGGDNS